MLNLMRKWRRQLGTLAVALFIFPMFFTVFSADTSFKDNYMPWSGRTITGITSITATTGTFTNLTGFVIGTNVQAHDDILDDLSGLTQASDKLPYFNGATTAATADFTSAARDLLDDANAGAMRTTLDAQQQQDILDDFGGLTQAANKMVYFDTATSAAAIDLTTFARSILDDANEATFKATVNLEVGTDVQGYDAQLDDFAGLSPTAGRLIFGDGANFTLQTTAQAQTHLSLVPGTDVQAYHEELANIVGLTMTDSYFAVGNGSDIVMEAPATARTSLGLGDISTQTANNIDITGGTVDGVTITNSSFSGSVNQQMLIKTASYTASAGEIIGLASAGGSFRVTLPTNPTAGDRVVFIDIGRVLETNAVVIDAGEATDHMNGTTQSLSLDWNGLHLECGASSVSAWTCSGT